MTILGYYLPTGSPLHRLDPRVKIISAVSLSMVVLQAGPLILTAAAIFLAVVIAISRLPLAAVVKAIKPTLPLPLMILLLHLFFTKDTPWSPLLPISEQGLAAGLLLAGRFLLLFLSAMLLTMVTLPSEMIRGIEKLCQPLALIGIPTGDLSMMLSIALRFVPVILGETAKIREAQSARGADFRRGSPWRRLTNTASLIIPLTFNTCRRAEELTLAIEARGYQGGRRTYPNELTMKRSDYLIIIVVTLVTAALLLY